jgi:hypothetical protein
MGTGSFSGVKSGRGVTLNSHPLLVPWSRKGRGTPLLPLWAVRPVQSLSACTRVHFTFFFTLDPLADKEHCKYLHRRHKCTDKGKYNSNKSPTRCNNFPVYFLTFIYRSTCFGRFPAHNQEFNDCSAASGFAFVSW